MMQKKMVESRVMHVEKQERYSNEVPILQVSVLFFSDSFLLLLPTVLNRYLNFLLLSKQAVCLSYTRLVKRFKIPQFVLLSIVVQVV